ncbi:MAG TPA: sulfate ABC transporter permease subunit CysT [Acidobacteriota bacterium]|jgi:sulfate transport system permease protein
MDSTTYTLTRTSAHPWGRWGLRTAAIIYLAVMIVLPLASILKTGVQDGLGAFWNDIANPVAIAALKLTVFTALAATIVNAVMGTLTAYVLVRYDFTGRRLLDGLVDMPFAIPTLVTGVMLVVLYGPQRIVGAWLESKGIQVIFATPGIVLAMLLVTYPFVVRAVQPVLLELEKDQEEAAFTIGANRWVTFCRVVLPAISPAVITGSLLNFGRALGEFGAIVIVAGNIPGRTLTAAVHVYGQIESQNQRAASAISILLLALSFLLLSAVNWIQRRWEVPHAGI